MSGRNDKTWQEIVEEPIVQEIIDARNKRLEQIWKGKLLGAYNGYLARKRKGDYSFIVEEWDAFELEKLEYEIKKYKGDVEMSERRVAVRLVKDYNPIEVEVSGIKSTEEFNVEKQWAFNQAIELINQIPDGGFDSKNKPTSVKPSTYAKQKYPPKQHEPKPSKAYVSLSDISPAIRLSDGQKKVALKKIQSGDVSLEQVNAIKTYDELQQVVFGK